jgi:hypothetical protein
MRTITSTHGGLTERFTTDDMDAAKRRTVSLYPFARGQWFRWEALDSSNATWTMTVHTRSGRVVDVVVIHDPQAQHDYERDMPACTRGITVDPVAVARTAKAGAR